VDAVLDDPDRPVEEVLARFRPHSGDEERLREIVREVAAGAKALDGKPREAVLRWAMGLVMREFRSRVDPREAKQRLEGALAEEVKS
jgi:Asp-tRNA(Asn)/Glu-tRNA(Gln) amidotransferase B subunit